MKMKIQGLDEKEIKDALSRLIVVTGAEGSICKSLFEKEIIENEETENEETICFEIVKKGILMRAFPSGGWLIGMEFYIMSIAGDQLLKGKVIKWFEEFLGDPLEIQEIKGEISGEQDYIYWSAKKVDEKLKGG
ncbi:hypothetical protein KAS79_03315 [Candidatus Parcubacteria bacterium]|nr:hypothetical protein [Candidatus Parcubacteria bacterium]